MTRNLKAILMQGVSKIAMSIHVTNIVENRKRELKEHWLRIKPSKPKDLVKGEVLIKGETITIWDEPNPNLKEFKVSKVKLK